MSYAIGVAEPLSIHVDTYGTAKEGTNDKAILAAVKKAFDFRCAEQPCMKRNDLRTTFVDLRFDTSHPGSSQEGFRLQVRGVVMNYSELVSV